MSAPIEPPPAGQALIIYGQEGCGKTTLAAKLTGHQGPWPAKEVYFEDHWTRLFSGFPHWPRNAPNFVIVDGFPDDLAERVKVASLVAATEFEYETKGKEPQTLRKMPRFIFTPTQCPRQPLDQRRFVLYRAGF